MRRLSVVGFLLALTVLSSVGLAKAAEPMATPGIALTPVIQDKVLGPNEKSTSFSVQLTNQTSQSVTFSLSSNDFTELNQTGGLTFLGTDSRRVVSGHGLSSILRLDSRQVTIPANSTKTVTATIDDVAQLAPGGHYAAILAQAVPNDTSQNGNKVTINQVVSSLIFLETAGEGTKTVTLLPPALNRLAFNLPSSIDLPFKATGNTQTVPRGIVSVLHGDTLVSRGIINENSSILLPDTTRLLNTTLTGNHRPLWPGMYTLSVQYRYEGSLGVTSYQKRFLYINVAFAAVLLAVVVLILLGLYKIRRKLPRWPQKSQVVNNEVIVEPDEPAIVVKNRSQSAQRIIVKKRRIKRS